MATVIITILIQNQILIVLARTVSIISYFFLLTFISSFLSYYNHFHLSFFSFFAFLSFYIIWCIPASSEIPEGMLIRDIIYAFQAIDGKYIRYDSKLDLYAVDPTVPLFIILSFLYTISSLLF